MIKSLCLITGLMLGVSSAVWADDAFFSEEEGVTSFQKDKEAWRRNEVRLPQTETKKQEILSEIKQAIGDAAWNNISQAEQIFCYEVTTKPQDYDGYTLNNMALTAFCGVIKDDIKQNVLDAEQEFERRIEQYFERKKRRQFA